MTRQRRLSTCSRNSSSFPPGVAQSRRPKWPHYESRPPHPVRGTCMCSQWPRSRSPCWRWPRSGRRPARRAPRRRSSPPRRASSSRPSPGTGNVEAGADIDVNFQTSGTLSQVYVKAGQHVNKGQLLATLDSGLRAAHARPSGAEPHGRAGQPDDRGDQCGPERDHGKPRTRLRLRARRSSCPTRSQSRRPTTTTTTTTAQPPKTTTPTAPQQTTTAPKTTPTAEHNYFERVEQRHIRQRLIRQRLVRQRLIRQRLIRQRLVLRQQLDLPRRDGRLRPGGRVQRRGERQERQDRALRDEALRADQRHDRVALEPAHRATPCQRDLRPAPRRRARRAAARPRPPRRAPRRAARRPAASEARAHRRPRPAAAARARRSPRSSTPSR